MPRSINNLTREQYDAIIAGLRLLMSSLDAGTVKPNDGDVGDILTCSGEHSGLDAGQIDEFCNELLHS